MKPKSLFFALVTAALVVGAEAQLGPVRMDAIQPKKDERLERFLTAARRSMFMQQTESGLLYRIILPGAGPRPRPQDTVVVTIIAAMPDGKTRLPQLSGQGMHIKVNELPSGLSEGVQMLGLGAHCAFVLPPDLSFGDGPWPQGVEPGTPIMVQLNLDEIVAERRDLNLTN